MPEPQTDVLCPSALPTANLLQRGVASQSLVDQNSAEYLDAIEEEWNKKVDLEVETLLDGMVDFVGLASIGDKDKFRIAQESFQAQTRAESMAQIAHRRDTELKTVQEEKEDARAQVATLPDELIRRPDANAA
ncbi:hypothetical protein B0H16DRAFT_1505262 [Mycena metata]|uniref:Uncharacterized protein n=1 Tax=Mycena metata TaxID=1033252 RepID=A0AAD7NV95_9AGAR|nr:hypothetical protein B0H16DRAFT_1505262 [Mycena metata]